MIAPEGVLEPNPVVLRSREAVLSVTNPVEQNGVIANFSILFNSTNVATVQNPGNISVSGLQPYSSYVVVLVVCTGIAVVLSKQFQYHEKNTTIFRFCDCF